MEQQVYELISSGKNVLLVGKRDSGKTYFVMDKLIPFLKSKGMRVAYFKDLNETISPADKEVVILNEVEILDDKEFLKNLHPDDSPFYTEEYLKQVDKWLEKIRSIKNPTIYIVTRNEDEEIENMKKIETFSFGDNIEVVEYLKN